MNITVKVLGVLVLAMAAGVGCDDATGTGGAGGAGTTSASSTKSSSVSTGSGTTGSTGSTMAGPQAPVMESVEPLTGGLHVMWMNVTADCDMIELLRNKDGGSYATAYTLAGAATSQHDEAAMAPGMYCYKARCKKGAQTSPDSNEKCGTP